MDGEHGGRPSRLSPGIHGEQQSSHNDDATQRQESACRHPHGWNTTLTADRRVGVLSENRETKNHGVQSATDFVEIRQEGHWKVALLHHKVNEKGLDTSHHTYPPRCPQRIFARLQPRNPGAHIQFRPADLEE